MVQSTRKNYVPLDVPNGGYASRTHTPSNNMSFAKKAATLNGGRDNGNGTGFRTDTAISGNRFQGERELKPWVPDADIPDPSLEPAGMSKGGSGSGWDQFAVNEQKFGLQTTYDENIYTTTIDRSHPDYHKRQRDADRIAREIEGSTTTNRHVAEERVRDNVVADNTGLDEEDKYSGVQRQDFPPLTASANKYQPPGRRAPAAAKTQVAAIPTEDPAIISSRIASPAAKQTPTTTNSEQPQPKAVPKASPKASPNPEVSTPPTTTESSFAATPDAKGTPANTSAAGSRTVSPKPATPVAASSSTKPEAPSATSTVERDVVTAFKGFAQQQRSQAEKVRLSKAKADKESKLQELKAFSVSFKLQSVIPSDLVAIIAKDPAKQRAIQEAARRQAEEVQQEKATKTGSSQSVSHSASPAAPATPADPKTAQRTAAPASNVPSNAPRHTPGRAPNQPNGMYNSNTQQFRQDRGNMRGQGTPYNGPQQPMGPRMQQRNGPYPGAPYDNRQPPTGPADAASRRTSTTSSKLNAGSMDFRPSASAAAFVPNGSGKPSVASTPRSGSAPPGPLQCESASGLLIKRRPGEPSKKNKNKKPMSIIDRVASEKPPPEQERKWARHDGIKPAHDTLPIFRQPADEEPADSTMNMTYAQLFEKKRFAPATMSPRQPAHPQVPHQHQLPFHLQQGAPRASPRGPPMHMQNHNMGQQFHANNDDHRMMPSLSAQSFASPRMQPLPMAYPSPAMGQPAQIFQPGMQPVMHYMSPGAPQMVGQFRSYSNAGQQFIPQQPSHMGGPVMMAGPQGAPFYGSPNLMAPQPQPQMMYPNGQPMPMMQQAGPPMSVPGASGYPSPGRPVGAPIMMQSGSQQGSQQGFPMSPGMQYGQPIYAQQVPQHMQQQMRFQNQAQGPQFQSPMPHFNQPHHNGNGNGRHNTNGYNRHNNHNGNGHQPHQNGASPGQGPHGASPATANNVAAPVGPQGPTPAAADEAK